MLRGTAGYGCRLVCMPPRGAWYAAPCAVTPGRVVAMPVISASRSTHHYAAEQHHGFDTGPSTRSGAPRQAVAASIRIGHWARGPQPSATAAARERGPNATRRAHNSRRRKFACYMWEGYITATRPEVTHTSAARPSRLGPAHTRVSGAQVWEKGVFIRTTRPQGRDCTVEDVQRIIRE